MNYLEDRLPTMTRSQIEELQRGFQVLTLGYIEKKREILSRIEVSKVERDELLKDYIEYRETHTQALNKLNDEVMSLRRTNPDNSREADNLEMERIMVLNRELSARESKLLGTLKERGLSTAALEKALETDVDIRSKGRSSSHFSDILEKETTSSIDKHAGTLLNAQDDLLYDKLKQNGYLTVSLDKDYVDDLETRTRGKGSSRFSNNFNRDISRRIDDSLRRLNETRAPYMAKNGHLDSFIQQMTYNELHGARSIMIEKINSFCSVPENMTDPVQTKAFLEELDNYGLLTQPIVDAYVQNSPDKFLRAVNSALGSIDKEIDALEKKLSDHYNRKNTRNGILGKIIVGAYNNIMKGFPRPPKDPRISDASFPVGRRKIFPKMLLPWWAYALMFFSGGALSPLVLPMIFLEKLVYHLEPKIYEKYGWKVPGFDRRNAISGMQDLKKETEQNRLAYCNSVKERENRNIGLPQRNTATAQYNINHRNELMQKAREEAQKNNKTNSVNPSLNPSAGQTR